MTTDVLADPTAIPTRPEVQGIRRSVRLFRAFRVEQTDPNTCYRTLARDAVDQVARYASLSGATILDIGGGPGYFAEAARTAGAVCFTADVALEELALHERCAELAVVADGPALPVRSAAIDICCSFNVIEHVPDPTRLLDEMVRATRPGGTVFLSATTWLSPWGGHETSPWHYLGGRRAADRYQRRHGRAPKNEFGKSLFKVHIRDLLRWASAEPRVAVIDARPRYYPTWCRSIVRLPGIREVATWNLALVLRRR